MVREGESRREKAREGGREAERRRRADSRARTSTSIDASQSSSRFVASPTTLISRELGPQCSVPVQYLDQCVCSDVGSKYCPRKPVTAIELPRALPSAVTE